MQKTYELMVLLHPDLEIDAEAPIAKVESLVEAVGGNVIKRDNWGKKRLAYRIRRQDFAIYIYFEIALDPLKVAPLEKTILITEEVLRHILVVQEEAATHKESKKSADKKADGKADTADDKADGKAQVADNKADDRVEAADGKTDSDVEATDDKKDSKAEAVDGKADDDDKADDKVETADDKVDAVKADDEDQKIEVSSEEGTK